MQHLKTIIPSQLARERHAARERDRRQMSGATDRPTYATKRQVIAAQRREQAKLLKDKGFSLKEIVEKIGVGLIR
ncbi:hypothetical protein CCP3SC1AL1_2320001 [Gammaproteobacteria bacterium]